jgi:hypothetical protein
MTRLSTLAFALFGLALVMSACGSGESTSAGTEVSEGTTTQRPGGAPSSQLPEPKVDGGAERNAAEPPGGAPKPQFTPRRHHDSAGGAERFKVKGGDNSVLEFGREASSSDFAEAAEALHGFLDARAASAWTAACGYLAPAIRVELIQQFDSVPNQENPTCAKLIAALSALPEATLRETAVADIAAFRVEDDGGFILFSGARSVHSFVPMRREDGRWWVAAPSPSTLP